MPGNTVTASLATPETLEKLYHDNPTAFVRQLQEALQNHPHSQILQFWRTRIEFQQARSPVAPDLRAQLPRLLALCLAAALLIKLPLVFPLTEEWFYTRFTPMIVIGSLIMYFVLRQRLALDIAQAICCIALLVLTMALVLPYNGTSASVIMALLHAPLVLWSALGLSFAAANWRSATARLDYLRYNGELFIYTVLILLGGFVLSGMTLGLFSLLNLSIEEWYLINIIPVGLVAAPLVATFLYDIVLQRQSRLATLIANVFTPLFLVMICVYLIAMLVQQQSPYTNREFLILFNGLLLLVLAMTIFSIAGRNSRTPSLLADTVNFGLIAVTLIVNMVALSAILYRLAEWGLTPNRLVVTGANLLIFIHLITILVSYLRVLRGQRDASALTGAIAGMLPVYTAWSVFVMIAVPLLFRFQ